MCWRQQHPYPTPDDKRERLAVLEEAIQRHHDNGYPPPDEWVEEARVHRADLEGQ
jgi:hypothetical protein